MPRFWTLVLAGATAGTACTDHDPAAPTGVDPVEQAVGGQPGSSRSASPVYPFDSDRQVGRSSLLRNRNGVHSWIETGELEPGHAITIWLVIFNAPENCTGPCDMADLFDLNTLPDAVWAGGTVVGKSGRVRVVGHVRKGDLSGTTNPPFGFPPIGLIEPMRAELHLVVKTHGPVIPGLEREMTTTYGGGCDDAPPGLGTPGPNSCAEIQFSEHKPPTE